MHRHEQVRFDRPHHHPAAHPSPLLLDRFIYLLILSFWFIVQRLRSLLGLIAVHDVGKSSIIGRRLHLPISLLDRSAPNCKYIAVTRISKLSVLRLLPRQLHTPIIDISLSPPNYYLSLTLLPILPEPTIAQSALAVIQLPISMAIIVLEVALVVPPTLPEINSVARLLIHRIVPFIHLYLLVVLLPDPVPIAKAMLEITLERTAICPNVLPIALRQAIHKFALIVVTICKPLSSFTMFQSIFEDTHIQVTVYLLMNPLAIGQPSPPLSFIILCEIIAFGVFGGEVEPVELALPVLLAVQKLADIQIPIGIYLNAMSVLLIPNEISLIESAILAGRYALALPLLTHDLTEIDLAVAFDQLQLFALQQRLNRQIDVGRGLVVGEEIDQLLLPIAEDSGEGLLLVEGVHAQDFDAESELLAIETAVLLGEGHLDLWVAAVHWRGIKLKNVTFGPSNTKLSQMLALIKYSSKYRSQQIIGLQLHYIIRLQLQGVSGYQQQMNKINSIYTTQIQLDENPLKATYQRFSHKLDAHLKQAIVYKKHEIIKESSQMMDQIRKIKQQSGKHKAKIYEKVTQFEEEVESHIKYDINKWQDYQTYFKVHFERMEQEIKALRNRNKQYKERIREKFQLLKTITKEQSLVTIASQSKRDHTTKESSIRLSYSNSGSKRIKTETSLPLLKPIKQYERIKTLQTEYQEQRSPNKSNHYMQKTGIIKQLVSSRLPLLLELLEWYKKDEHSESNWFLKVLYNKRHYDKLKAYLKQHSAMRKVSRLKSP